jgi:glycosyltransferase XagB
MVNKLLPFDDLCFYFPFLPMNLPISRAVLEALLSGHLSAKLAPPLPLEGATRAPAALPAALAFLTNYGVSAEELAKAALQARRQGVPPEAALLANGAIREGFYYRCLAHSLGAQFTCGPARISDGMRYPYAVRAGLLPLEGPNKLKWLAAPRGRLLNKLLAWPDGRQLSRFVAITTPSHLSRLARSAAALSIVRDASLGLACLDPDLSAKTPPNKLQRGCAMAGAGGAALAIGVAPGPALAMLSLAMTCVFLLSVWLRLFAGAASSACCTRPFRGRIDDRRLPFYSIVVALHREARVVRQLIGALAALDYPRAKLDIKLVIEHDDHATGRAIEALQLPANYETIVAPKGWPKTKPRALNIALPQLRGDFAVVYDAEDIPAPGQLREAAERFARAPRMLACLQARLAIDNSEDSWLTRLFAIEYSVLFDVVNPGYAALGLPVPLGGSSNHFRTEVLRDVCGWDAWNVTEDADLGLRLARFGYDVGILSSTTEEEAPAKLDTWLNQRRRWSKGWFQTFITLTRDPGRLIAELGILKTTAIGLMMTNMVVAPPLWPFFAALVVRQLSIGALAPASPLELATTVLWISAVVFGAGSILWLALLGMNRRRLMKLWPFLPLVPLYYLLASVAAWMALYDLISRPYHWHKTEHGLAKTTRQASQPGVIAEGMLIR